MRIIRWSGITLISLGRIELKQERVIEMKLSEALKKGNGRAKREGTAVDCDCFVELTDVGINWVKSPRCKNRPFLPYLYNFDNHSWIPFPTELKKDFCTACVAAAKITETSHGSNLMRIHLTRTIAQGGHCTCKEE